MSNFIEEYLKFYEKYSKIFDKMLVLMQVGSFYESHSTDTKGPDLTVLADLTDIPCISKTYCGRLSMWGFPTISLVKNVKYLTTLGYTVVVINQIGKIPNITREVVAIHYPDLSSDVLNEQPFYNSQNDANSHDKDESKENDDGEFKFTVTIDSTLIEYHRIHRFLCNMYIKQYATNPKLSNLVFNSKLDNMDSDSDNDDNIIIDDLIEPELSDLNVIESSGSNSQHPVNPRGKVRYNLPYSEQIVLKYKKNNILCVVNKVSDVHGLDNTLMYLRVLKISGNTKSLIDNVILSACKEQKKTFKIYSYNIKYERWISCSSVHNRESSTLILDADVKNKILTDVDTFIKSKVDYEKFGIPYRRNYLFYGKPGTGKTSFVNIIANKINRPIYIISFSPQLTDDVLFTAIKNMARSGSSYNNILLLEDVDCVFEARDDVGSSDLMNSGAKQEIKKCGASFSGLLNLLNGVIRTDGLITFLTTNHIAKLDKALIRPGRIDMMLKFDIISQQQITDMLTLYGINLSNPIYTQIVKICAKNNLTPAMLSGFMFRHRNLVLNDENYIELFTVYLGEIQYAIDKKDEHGYHC
jgi:hypothetical protein